MYFTFARRTSQAAADQHKLTHHNITVRAMNQEDDLIILPQTTKGIE